MVPPPLRSQRRARPPCRRTSVKEGLCEHGVMDALPGSTLPPTSMQGLLDLLEEAAGSPQVLDPPEQVRASCVRGRGRGGGTQPGVGFSDGTSAGDSLPLTVYLDQQQGHATRRRTGT